MKRFIIATAIFMITLCTGCAHQQQPAQLVATTLPVYDFTEFLCRGTQIHVQQLINDPVSCLHDYTLTVSQMRAIENAEHIIISGGGLEEFLEDVLTSKDRVIDASAGIELHCSTDEHNHAIGNNHHHDTDPHIWLSPTLAVEMAKNISSGLCATYPQHSELIQSNLTLLTQELTALSDYGQTALSDLTCRELVTFHDGFSYLAEEFDLTILHSVEEDEGSEASAKDLIHICEIVTDYSIPAIFTEKNGSNAAASVIQNETGTRVFALDMAMSSDNYFDAMRHNIDTLKEALG